MSDVGDGADKTSKVESRFFMLAVGICLSLGGWWLQNQWTATEKVNDRLTDFVKHVDDTYVDEKYIGLLEGRLTRIEDKLDKVLEHARGASAPQYTAPRGRLE